MKRYLIVLILCVVVIPLTIKACPSGWEYVYEQGVPSAGFDFADQGTHYVGTGAVYDEEMFFRNLLVVDIAAWEEWPYDTLWARTYEDIQGEGRSIIKVPDGYAIAGYVPEYTDSGGPHVLMVMIDDTGQVMWENYEAQGIGNSVTATPDGGYLVTGQGRILSDDLLLVKYDASGDTVWTRTHGSDDYDQGYTISPTSDGNYVIAGTSGASSYTGQDGELWWLKIDGDGEIIWEHTHGAQYFDYWGTSIAELDDGGFVIGAGSGEQGVEVAKNLVVVKTDASGEAEWIKEHYACLYFNDPTSYWVDATADGGYIATGMGFNFIKLDGTGGIEWKREYISDYSNPLSCCVRQTPQDRYVAVGVAEDMFYMIDADHNGEIWIPGIEANIAPPPGFHVLTPVGKEIVISYSNLPESSMPAIEIYDATGRKVDELHAPLPLGTISWGQGYGPGVYFIRDESDSPTTHKVVLIQ